MCMSRLRHVVSCEGDARAIVDDPEGRRTSISLLALDGPPPQPGEWLVVHSGYAIDRLEADEAHRTLDELTSGGGRLPAGGSL